jgi:UDP-N-acetylmuramoyl-L-alanyl-D-glutamate--2,6-diaminopimelate ligase
VADFVVVTSDNPRSENPPAILAEVEVGVKKVTGGSERYATIEERREAIAFALARARPGDLVVLAGKGHETYQVLRDRTIPFDDRVVAREVLAALGYPGAGPGPGTVPGDR